jgi:ArsR family transcriptional regulator
LSLIPDSDPVFGKDSDKLRALRGARTVTAVDATDHDRPLHRALVALTVAEPLGDLVDIGCGQGRILKLLATRARRAVGVDIDSDLRRFARAELLLAGLPNCSLRQGDMYSLPFTDHEFDTAILDDVLSETGRPTEAIAEAVRILRPGGRLLILLSLAKQDMRDLQSRLAGWCAETGLRLAPARAVPAQEPQWLLAVATKHDAATAAA